MKVLIGMSGGVDSAVSAFLLKKKGYNVVGANMRFWEYKDSLNSNNNNKNRTSCCSPEDIQDAQKSAMAVGIPFYIIKMEENFQKYVIDPFMSTYQKGKTPNPCVECNTFIKFGEFYEKAYSLGFANIATGHYAKIQKTSDNRYAIFPPKDTNKNQGYFLYALKQDALKSTLFPLSEFTKQEARKIAEENSLHVAKKPESQEICFVPDNNYRNFLKNQNISFQKGFIRDTAGRILKKHQGKENYTIGQRKGLSISHKEPLYVLSIHSNGDVIVGTKKELSKSKFVIENVTFQGIDPKEIENKANQSINMLCLVQVRYNSSLLKAKITIQKKENHQNIEVELETPVSALTPGQSAVLYHIDEKYILAGGKIK